MKVSFSVSPLIGTVYQHQPGKSYSQEVFITPPPPASAVPLILDPQGLLVPGTCPIRIISDIEFRADLPINGELPVGRHQGNLSLVLYRDASRTSTYNLAGATCPYDFTVTPLVTAEFKVEGITQAPLSNDINNSARYYKIRLHSGQTLEVDASHSLGAWNPMMSGGPTCVQLAGCTATVWKGTFTLAHSADSKEIGSLNNMDPGSGETLQVAIEVVP